MKGKLLVILLLLIILVGGAPFLSGLLVQAGFDDVLKLANQSGDVEITLVEYKRGWLRSTAITSLENEETRALNKRIELSHEIQHGPLVKFKEGTVKQWKVVRGAIYSTLLDTSSEGEANASSKPPEIQAQSVFSLGGDVDILLQIPHFEYSEPSIILQSKNVDFNWHIRRGFKNVRFEGILAEFRLAAANKIAIELRDLDHTSDLTKSDADLWVGTYTSKTSHARIVYPFVGLQLVGTDLSSQGKASIKNALLSFSGVHTLSNLALGNTAIGPVTLVNSLENIDVVALKKVIEINQKMKQSPQEKQEGFREQLMALIPTFLADQPKINIDELKVKTHQGMVSGMLNVVLGGPEVKQFDLNAVYAKLSLTVPKALFMSSVTQAYVGWASFNQQIQQAALSAQGATAPSLTPQELVEQAQKEAENALAAWLAEGILEESGEDILLDLEFKEGVVRAKGKVVEIKLVAPQGESAPATSDASPAEEATSNSTETDETVASPQATPDQEGAPAQNATEIQLEGEPQ